MLPVKSRQFGALEIHGGSWEQNTTTIAWLCLGKSPPVPNKSYRVLGVPHGPNHYRNSIPKTHRQLLTTINAERL